MNRINHDQPVNWLWPQTAHSAPKALHLCTTFSSIFYLGLKPSIREGKKERKKNYLPTELSRRQNAGAHLLPLLDNVKPPLRCMKRGPLSSKALSQSLWKYSTCLLSNDSSESLLLPPSTNLIVSIHFHLRKLYSKKGERPHCYMNRTEWITSTNWCRFATSSLWSF